MATSPQSPKQTNPGPASIPSSSASSLTLPLNNPCGYEHNPISLDDPSFHPSNNHSALDLITLIQQFSPLSLQKSQLKLSALQANAFLRYSTSPLSNLTNWRIENTLLSDILRHFFEIFDDIFFFGALQQKHVQLSILDRTNSGDIHACGETKPYAEHRIGAEITIYKAQKSLFRSEYHTLKENVDSLIHQMCHACLMLLSCQRGCYADFYTGSGITGHSIAWQDLAFLVERHTWDDTRFRNLQLDLERLPSLKKEVYKALPNTNKMMQYVGGERWGFGEEDYAEWDPVWFVKHKGWPSYGRPGLARKVRKRQGEKIQKRKLLRTLPPPTGVKPAQRPWYARLMEYLGC